MKRFGGVVLALVTVGCGPVSSQGEGASGEVPGWVRSAIVGGTVETGDPNVFELAVETDTGAGGTCTATLIDTRTLITAAHCVDPVLMKARWLTIYATNAPRETAMVLGSNAWKVTETRTHPDWNSVTLDGDMAFALLPHAMTIDPKPWSADDPTPYVGHAIRAVGYGTIGHDQGSGIKRTVDLTLRAMDDRNLYLGNQVSKGICHGDSGGPTFMSFPDGVERLIGVHSFTVTEDCLDGADTRLDLNVAFMRSWLQEKESASCNEDGRCKQGCAPPDVDCLCGADGVCSPDCPDLLKDPDCPRDCARNGVCASQACPVPDPDCVIERGPCTADAQCQQRKCASDPMHNPYCSTFCVANQDCAPDMECDVHTSTCLFQQLTQVRGGSACAKGVNVCSDTTVCTGPGAGATYCAPTCRAKSDCEAGLGCTPGYDGQKYCHLPTVSIPLAVVEGPVAQGGSPGCASAGGGVTPWAVALALTALLARRRSA